MEIKILRVISLCVAILMLLCSCQMPATKLEAPKTLSVNNNNIINWRSVDGAISYIVVIDGEEQTKVINPQFDLKPLGFQVGQTIKIKVKAVGDGVIYKSSDDSVELVYTYKESTLNGNETSSIETKGEIKKHEKYQIISAPETTFAFSYTDGSYNYYVYDLGYVRNVPIWYSTGQDYTGTPLELSYEEEETIVNSLEENIETTVSKTVSEQSLGSAGIDVKTKVESKFPFESGSASVEVGVSYNRQWGTITDNSNSTTSSEKTFSSIEKKTKKGVKYIIGNHGEEVNKKYRLTLLTHYDMYMTVITTTDNKKIEKKTLVLSAREGQAFFAFEKTDWNSDFEDGNVDVESLIELPDVELNDLIIHDSGKPQYDFSEKVYKLETDVKYCAENNGYNYTKTSSGLFSGSWWTEIYFSNIKLPLQKMHNDFQMGNLFVSGVKDIQNGKYSLINEDEITLKYEFLQDTNNIPEKGTYSAKVVDDTYSKNIYKTQTSGKEVGYGMMLVEILYTDGTSNIDNVYEDFFKDRMPNRSETKTLKLDESKIVKEINITVIYEIKYYNESISKWGYTNWRSDYKIDFSK